MTKRETLKLLQIGVLTNIIPYNIMTRRRGGTQTRILWLLYCQLYDSPYPTYYLKNDKELLFYTDYVWICVCAVL